MEISKSSFVGKWLKTFNKSWYINTTEYCVVVKRMRYVNKERCPWKKHVTKYIKIDPIYAKITFMSVKSTNTYVCVYIDAYLYLRDKHPWISHILNILYHFLLWVTFQGCLYSKQLWKIENVLLWDRRQRAEFLLSRIKKITSPSKVKVSSPFVAS